MGVARGTTTGEVVAGLRAASLRRLARRSARRALVGCAIAGIGWVTGVASLAVYRGSVDPRAEETLRAAGQFRAEEARVEFEPRRMDLQLRRLEEEIARKRGAPIGDEERTWLRAREPSARRGR